MAERQGWLNDGNVAMAVHLDRLLKDLNKAAKSPAYSSGAVNRSANSITFLLDKEVMNANLLDI